MPSDQPTPAASDQEVILLCDDEPIVRTVIRMTLEAEGYLVLVAGDGDEALDVSRSFPGTIHCLISDVLMPNLDGLSLRHQILKERPAIEVLLISAQLPVTLEGVAFLAKPFTPAVLASRVRALLTSARGTSA